VLVKRERERETAESEIARWKKKEEKRWKGDSLSKTPTALVLLLQ
jgi:hypothetical protein